MPFDVASEAEAITLFAVIMLTMGLFIFNELKSSISPVVAIAGAGMMFYLFTVADSMILKIAFIGLTIYQLFKMVK